MSLFFSSLYFIFLVFSPPTHTYSTTVQSAWLEEKSMFWERERENKSRLKRKECLQCFLTFPPGISQGWVTQALVILADFHLWSFFAGVADKISLLASSTHCCLQIHHSSVTDEVLTHLLSMDTVHKYSCAWPDYIFISISRHQDSSPLTWFTCYWYFELVYVFSTKKLHRSKTWRKL